MNFFDELYANEYTKTNKCMNIHKNDAPALLTVSFIASNISDIVGTIFVFNKFFINKFNEPIEVEFNGFFSSKAMQINCVQKNTFHKLADFKTNNKYFFGTFKIKVYEISYSSILK
uniref:Uncharacterized protein n=1 Tax=Glossina brevipalpis TaxID=37001 RepID=A0A1A9W204_9MUSC